MRQSTVRGGLNTRATAAMTRLSQRYQQDNDLSPELEQKYLNIITQLISARALDQADLLALQSLAQEYVKNKNLIQQMMDQADEICEENDVKILIIKLIFSFSNCFRRTKNS